jgi:hypothetical protein
MTAFNKKYQQGSMVDYVARYMAVAAALIGVAAAALVYFMQ